MPSAPSFRVAADVGGTFTDIVAFDEASGRLVFGKTLTTPTRLVDGIVTGVDKAGTSVSLARLFLHGSTIAINTMLERSGAKTALLTTRGFRDIYEIGRINRPQAYNLFFRKHQPLIRRSLRFEVNERVGAAGQVLTALDEAQLADIARQLHELEVQAVAILFFHSYCNPAHELRAKELIEQWCPGTYVSASHEISQEYREFERTSTVAANAYIGPRIKTYLGEIQERFAREKFAGSFYVVQSNGGLFDVAQAQRECIRMLESGPAAGVIGARAVCERLDLDNAIAFDMGGTTAKAGVVLERQVLMAGNIMVGGYDEGLPIQIPLIDTQEVGTGGGSIARIEEGGGLRVGPQSAGAAPGPVCYDLGGSEPTVTDANLVLGRLSAGNFLGGEMKLNFEKARQALSSRIAEPAGISLTEAANGIIRIAATTMSNVVTRVTTERGLDAGDFAMVAYGGAGPLHASMVARELRIPKVIIPPSPGHFSAYGMLMADMRRDFVRTWFRAVDKLDFAEFESLFGVMEGEGIATLARNVPERERIRCVRAADMRYVGQEHPVEVELPASLFEARDPAALKRVFDDVHMQRYEFNAVKEPAEIVSLHSTVIGMLDKPVTSAIAALADGESRSPTPSSRRPVYFTESGDFTDTPVYDRAMLLAGHSIAGPALVEEYASTTVLLPGDRMEVSRYGDLVITIARS
ncbi:MAG: 5-oxoprolinase [Betaproteobacteria bacterium RIFCSPLOWO2_02_FULL_62_17]|nr:MAG: 5-oxoprolinase [Betaproteobacteria bacterium RIFCSPLOWO2_02_FULL_62_17]